MNPLIHSEPLVGIGTAARRFPAHRGVGHIAPQTLVRWGLRGCRSAGGKRVYLELIRCGYRWMTSEAAVGRFLDALTDIPQGSQGPHALRPPASRNQASEAAAQELKKLGA